MYKKFEELSISDDFMFGVVMREPKYCKLLLELILKVKIRKIEYPISQQVINLSADAKSVRLDVYVEDDNNTVYNIEMQTGNKDNLPKRIRYYQGMIDLNILEKGETYKKLKKSFIIFICTFDLFGKGRHIYTFEHRCKEDLDLALGDDATVIILNTKGTLNDVSKEMKNLLDFIDGNAPADEFTKELETMVSSIRNNEKWRLDYMTLQMSYQEKFEEGKLLGREEGLAEGEARGKILGREEGKLLGTIEFARSLDYDDRQIIAQLMKQFNLSEEEAERYVLTPVK